jgi:hypothetical protein
MAVKSFITLATVGYATIMLNAFKGRLAVDQMTSWGKSFPAK